MAVNLRLRPEAAEALKAESERTGLSQQEILRAAVDEHLGLVPRTRAPKLPDWVTPASEAPRDFEPWIVLPDGVSSLDLINEQREERL